MKAIILNEPGPVENLIYEELEIPTPGPDEVLIKTVAIAINPVDVKTRAGKGIYGRLKENQPLILGWDISGIIESTGSAVKDFKKGDEVFGMVNFPGHGKAYAEYVTAPAAQLALKPKNISHQEAAASTLAALTAYQTLVHKANIQKGQQVLVHAAAGGVGHFAVQIAKHLGAIVTGTSSAQNKDFILSLGADKHIDYRVRPFSEVAGDMDVVLDTVGGDNIEPSMRVVKAGGMLISIPSGINDELTNKAHEMGIKIFFVLVQSSGDDMKQIANWLEQGIVKPYVSRTYDFTEMDQAHLAQETGRTVGKIVVNV